MIEKCSTKQPKVSVIMICFNSAKYLREAIDSVYAQSYKDWEIILWDNASVDDSVEIAKRYDSRLKLFENKKRVSLGKARNLAIERAQGEYIAFLDCDDIWMPEKLEKQISILERNCSIGIIFCDTIIFNEKGAQGRQFSITKPAKGKVFRTLLIRNFLLMPSVIIRKEALLKLDHWFDPRFNIIEEADLFLRIANDWLLDYTHEALAKYRVANTIYSWIEKKSRSMNEQAMMLEKFSKMYQNFDKQYAQEIGIIRSRIQYYKALCDLERGDNIRARRRMKPQLLNGIKFVLLYAMSYLPNAWNLYWKVMKARSAILSIPLPASPYKKGNC